MTATLDRSSPVDSSLVEISGLDVGYVRRRTVTPAVAGLDLVINPGEIVAIVGESGSGKTTTANALISLLPDSGRITAGSVRIDGTETVGAREKTLRGLRGSTVALIPQDPMTSLNPTRRIGSQIAEAVRLRGVTGEDVERESLEFLALAGVPEPERRYRQYPHELSGGLRQRVLIAIALAGRPKLIIADEPTSALDVTVQKQILDHLASLVREQGISLVIITHDLALAADRADRVLVMQHGRVVEQGDPATILRTPSQAYTRQLIAAAPGLATGGRIVPRQTSVPSAPILTLTGVTKTFAVNHERRGQKGFNALNGVSISVPRGQTHAIVGESGCGKTTALRIALGLETATSGSVVFDGTELSGLTWRALRPYRRRMQFVHQDPFASLDPKFTVRQSITEPLVAFGIGSRSSRDARARLLLDQVALPSAYLDRLPSELSGGQRQRVAIARSLAVEPDLLLLDEPVSALDVSVQEQILDLLAGLQRDLGLTYLFVSHDLAVVAQIAHTVSVLKAGQVVEEGTVQDVFLTPRSEYARELLDAIPGRRP